MPITDSGESHITVIIPPKVEIVVYESKPKVKTNFESVVVIKDNILMVWPK